MLFALFLVAKKKRGHSGITRGEQGKVCKMMDGQRGRVYVNTLHNVATKY